MTHEVEAEGQPIGDTPVGVLWAISAVSRKTGLTSHVLRAWERRFGAPIPVRLPSGHRRYTQAQVEHLTLVAQALAADHRASDVVPLSTNQLQELLAVEPLFPEPLEPQPKWLNETMTMIKAFDRPGLSGALRRSASAMGMLAFLEDRVASLLQEVGSAWHRGDLHIRHEHFATDVLLDLLRQLRMTLGSPDDDRPKVLLCTLPEETHGLGLQIVALVLGLYQWPHNIIGVQTPEPEIIALANELSPSVVGLTVTMYTATPETQAKLVALRQELPKDVALWVGGAGARLLQLPESIDVIGSLDTLQQTLRRLSPSGGM